MPEKHLFCTLARIKIPLELLSWSEAQHFKTSLLIFQIQKQKGLC